MNEFCVSCVQYAASDDITANLAVITRGVKRAAEAKAVLVQLPEMANLMQPDKGLARASIQQFGHEQFLQALQELAQKYGIWLHVGSLIVPAERLFYNRSYLIDDTGTVRGQYDKIHLFDADLAAGERYRESAHYVAGDQAVVLETPWGCLGMAICFDLRFSHLFSALVDAGADILCAPAAFTYTTGMAHWHPLVRSRAIEFGAPMIAANQGGYHARGLRTFGHSLIVDAWGTILAEGPAEGEACITSMINSEDSRIARQKIPKQDLRRQFHTMSLPQAKEEAS